MYVQGKKYAKSVIFIDIGQFRGGVILCFFSFLDGVGGGFEVKKAFRADVLFWGLLFLIV